MAFQATHVRFARDLARALKIEDFGAYYSGCVYPDSRYVTGTSREITHVMSMPLSEMSDFQKGQFTHVRYDKLVGPRYMDHSQWPGQPVTGIGPEWVYMTAAKLIEDELSFDALQEPSILQTLACPTYAPHNEDAALLERYYRLLRDLYREKPTMDGYLSLFRDFRLPETVAQHVRAQAEALKGKTAILDAINNAYAPALRTALDQIQSGNDNG